MRPLRFVRRNPPVVLGAFVAAFAIWVWQDAGSEPPVEATPPAGTTPRLIRGLPAPLPDSDVPRPVSHVSAQALPKLKPGMPRTEVEELVGAPSAVDISPATVSDGRVTYHMCYEADLAPLSTVRPLPGRRPARDAAERTLVTLEFDATKPGHPLVGVHYPDPLF